MSGVFTRVPLAAILGLAIGRVACAGTIDVPPAGGVAAPDAAFSQFSRLPQNEPPLQLALALSRETRQASPQLNEPAPEAAALRLTAQTAPLRPSTLALAAPAAETTLSQSARFANYEPPLRLALALNRERRSAMPQLNDDVPEPAAIQLTAQTRPLRFAALERPQEPVATLGEQAEPMEKLEPLLQKQEKPQAETAVVDLVPTWEIAPGDRTLNTTLSKWSASAGWQLVWDMDVDYPIESRAVLQGTFEEAVASVAQSLSAASVPIQATFYAGNRVLRIVAKGSK